MSDQTLTDYEIEVLRHINGDRSYPIGTDNALPKAVDKLRSLGLIRPWFVLTDAGRHALWSRTKHEGAKG